MVQRFRSSAVKQCIILTCLPNRASLPLPQVASLACRQRLLLSLIAAWPRRQDSQLSLSTERHAVLQRVCTEVEMQRALPSLGGSSSMGGALWHGIKVAFEQVGG